ncbi:hypothetical protein M0802_016455 [Mischocyttarus mexicanus]|nr:hypothetical protein M0802_016455 [Mischocyttarus mexicanus]
MTEKTMDWSSVAKKLKKSQTRTDEDLEEEGNKKTVRKLSPAPVCPDTTMDKEIKNYKIFENTVKLIEMEDIQNCDLQELKSKVPSMLNLIIKLAEENKDLKKNNKTQTSFASPESIESRLNKFEEAIKLATNSIRELKNHLAKTRLVTEIWTPPFASGTTLRLVGATSAKLLDIFPNTARQSTIHVVTVKEKDTHLMTAKTRIKIQIAVIAKRQENHVATLHDRLIAPLTNLPKQTTSLKSTMANKITGNKSKALIRIAQINAQNSKSVSDELRQIAYEKQIDILAIQEPYVHNNSIVGMGISAKIVTDT